MNRKLFHLGQAVCRMFFRLFYRVKIQGKQNIPEEQGVLLCSNHIHFLDPPLVGSFLKRETRFMAKAELFEAPILKSLIPKFGAFPINRGKSDRKAMRTGLKLLKEGEIVGVFPEGTRSKTGELKKGLSGVGFFALRSDAAVVPCAVIGPYRLFKTIHIIYGEPLNMDQLREEKASPEATTEAIMRGIQDLIDAHKASVK
ncbi:1-acyl-sn-glycerol-3-phosphate acyltransferase [Salisediminibacterium beveridgei]|uniref:1-acyl-sn-glycerol-3-phosphate acyltransferase n=2 Tax=Salisediminibacterium beveridgei TaxID=632773 RepID=A0A1D7QUW8_9BACI|nr:1-acyl-sn-glycerol-3-phosphate acyltransferase [Salisediminibacterium beveridgei]